MSRIEYAQPADPPFQKIGDAVKTTGFSAWFLRKGCRDGSIPCIRSGRTFYINIPQLVAQLSCQTETAVHGGVCNGKTETFPNF